MHSDEILAVCGVITLVGSVGAGLIQLTVLLSKIKTLEEKIAELKMETGIDIKELKGDFRSDMEGFRRELSDLRGANIVRGRPR
jgi:hypothetical protein